MSRRPSLFRAVGNKFFAGLLILVPIVITIQAFWWLFILVDDFSRPLARRLVDREIPGVGFAMTLALVWLIGLLFSAGPLRRLLDGLEELLEHIPMVGVVYSTTKKVFEGFGNLRSSDAFKRFVLARLPGRTTPGFLTGSFSLEQPDGSASTLCTVYIPTNHLYVGDVVVLPEKDVIETDLSVEDGISIVLSAGASVPERIGVDRS
ncbi:MAG: DUF502 domain-containing protein [bacterium]|nr:DUF502 domain-containing protein [bacterium]